MARPLRVYSTCDDGICVAHSKREAREILVCRAGAEVYEVKAEDVIDHLYWPDGTPAPSKTGAELLADGLERHSGRPGMVVATNGE
jgi:hypothetical protein